MVFLRTPRLPRRLVRRLVAGLGLACVAVAMVPVLVASVWWIPRATGHCAQLGEQCALLAPRVGRRCPLVSRVWPARGCATRQPDLGRLPSHWAAGRRWAHRRSALPPRAGAARAASRLRSGGPPAGVHRPAAARRRCPPGPRLGGGPHPRPGQHLAGVWRHLTGPAGRGLPATPNRVGYWA